jgi:4-hydroxybenzoate polyprenyltransferase
MADTHDMQENEPSYIPASFEKRTAAWMGVAYALMFLFVITFAIFTGGKELPGTFPLFLVPVAVAAAVISIYRQKKGTAPGGIVTTVIVVLCCVFAVILGLAMGIPALASALQTAYGA